MRRHVTLGLGWTVVLIAGVVMILLALVFMFSLWMEPEGKDLAGAVPFVLLPLGALGVAAGWSRTGGRAVRTREAIVAVGLAAGVLILWAAGTGSRQMQLHPLRFIEGRMVPPQGAGQVEGVIKNTTNRRYTEIRVRIALRDDARVLEVVEATIDVLEPGRTGTFRAPYRTDRAKYFLIESVRGTVH